MRAVQRAYFAALQVKWTYCERLQVSAKYKAARPKWTCGDLLWVGKQANRKLSSWGVGWLVWMCFFCFAGRGEVLHLCRAVKPCTNCKCVKN